MFIDHRGFVTNTLEEYHFGIELSGVKRDNEVRLALRVPIDNDNLAGNLLPAEDCLFVQEVAKNVPTPNPMQIQERLDDIY